MTDRGLYPDDLVYLYLNATNMICVSIRETDFSSFMKAVKRAESLSARYSGMVLELRLDICEITPDECREIFASASLPTIVSTIKSTRYLIPAAIDGGAGYVEVDYYARVSDFNRLDRRIAAGKVKKLLSYIDYSGTPSLSRLKSIYREAVSLKADIVRVVCQASSIEDARNIMCLYSYQNFRSIKKLPLMAFASGPLAALTSYSSLSFGAPWVNISLTKKSRSFDSQLTLGEFEDAVSRNLTSHAVTGLVEIPSSKSVAHRAILSAVLAKGVSNFGVVQTSRDIDFLLAFIRQLGAGAVYDEGGELHITGIKRKVKETSNEMHQFPGSLSDLIQEETTQTLYVGESGLLANFSLPLLAQLFPKINVTGEGKLMERNMSDVRSVLEDFGVNCILSVDDTLPMILEGQLQGGVHEVHARRGDPLISGLLMALPLGRKDSVLHVQGLSKISEYPKITMDILRSFGISITCEEGANSLTFNIPGRQKYLPVDMCIEGDWGAAMNFAVAGAVFGSVTMANLNPRSVQPDREILDILSDAGAMISISSSNAITVSRGPLYGFRYNISNKPFFFPILLVLAAFSEGESVIKGYSNLLELNPSRTLSVIREFTRMGVSIRVEDDEIRISGMSYTRRRLQNNMLKGGYYVAEGDHRVAMALTIASIGCDGDFSIDDMDCVNKSFPNFSGVISRLQQNSCK